MPKKFRFHGPYIDFHCDLESVRCIATTKAGRQCSRNCVIGVNYCYTHLLHEKHLKIKDTNHGKGLFAVDTKKARNAVIFKGRRSKRNRFGANNTIPGAVIIDYNGESITKAILENRYGEYTAPYAIANHHIKKLFHRACVLRGWV